MLRRIWESALLTVFLKASTAEGTFLRDFYLHISMTTPGASPLKGCVRVRRFYAVTTRAIELTREKGSAAVPMIPSHTTKRGISPLKGCEKIKFGVVSYLSV